MKLTRRKFIFIAFGSIAIVLFNNGIINKKILIYDSELKKYIIKFNKKRIYNLQNNFRKEVTEDLRNERTIWIENQIYTYAELYKKQLY